MAKYFTEQVTAVLARLGDSTQSIWTRTEIGNYIQEGYDDLTLRTGMLWKKAAPSGLDDVASQATYTLPTDLYKIERITWKKKRLIPLRASELQREDPRYETTTGDVWGYIQDGDGIGTIRKVRIPASTVSGNVSIEYLYRGTTLANATLAPLSHEFEGPPSASWSITTDLPRIAMVGFSLPAASTAFECPDRFVKYIRDYACARALERDGPGQDLKLSAFYQTRYDVGLSHVLRRRSRVQAVRTGSFGAPTKASAPPKPRLPWQYGKVVR